MVCPRCRKGVMIAGRQAWGCSRWREGCGVVVPFNAFGRTLTEGQMKALCARGRTPPTALTVDGRAVRGSLLLHLDATPPRLTVDVAPEGAPKRARRPSTRSRPRA